MARRLKPDEFRGLEGHDLAALGIPDEAAHLAACRAHGGRSQGQAMDNLMAFDMFRMAAILEGILARGLQGNASAADARAAGERARRIGEAGWRQVEHASLWVPSRCRTAPAVEQAAAHGALRTR